ncbi:Calcium-activated chloride channel regulator 1, partial [Galemys pyrenaicus]
GSNTSFVQVSDNGYENVIIAIHPDVPEDETLIGKIKDMVTEASAYLFEATEKRLFFKNVSILVPEKWKKSPDYKRPKRESYAHADIKVALPTVPGGDEPYTRQFTECGEKAEFIHLTPDFVLGKKQREFGPSGRVLVHEWAHLHWGVFDEYNEEEPFYAAKCSIGITGVKRVVMCQGSSCAAKQCRIDSKTKLYEKDCQFFPDKDQIETASIMFMQNINSINEFCSEKNPNREAPTLQNKKCNSRSTWEVNSLSEDFKNTMPMVAPPPPAIFSLLKISERSVYLVLDKSENMKKLIQITSNEERTKLIENLPTEASGGISICSGIEVALQVIREEHPQTDGAEIILLCAGENKNIWKCMDTDSWISDTVVIDSTVGKDTLFLVTWDKYPPIISVWDPNGTPVGNFIMDKDSKMAYLHIPETAKVGIWTYSLQAKADSEILTITVNSWPANSSVPPITVSAKINKDTNSFPRPVIVYSDVLQGLKIILFLALHLLLGVKSSMVNLSNNGYDGIVIAIDPSVPEDERLIQSLKEMVTEASTYLFQATKQRVYFRSVSILIPVTWKSKPEYLMPKQESYEQADVIVANPYLKYGDDPYTLQYGQCGEKGQYIHFTPNFLLKNNLHIYGSRGRVFVHEWAHLRWGVFDEYNVDQPFYISRKNTIEATRYRSVLNLFLPICLDICSTDITGTNVVVDKCQGGSCITRPCTRDSKTGLYEAICTFIPDKSQAAKASIMFMQSLDSMLIRVLDYEVIFNCPEINLWRTCMGTNCIFGKKGNAQLVNVTEFCTEKTHNPDAPNLQNKMCSRRSTWDIIMDSDDFKNASPMTETKPPSQPTFSLLKSEQRVVCLVLDTSGSMASDNRLFRMNQAAELYLIQIIEKGTLVGMVTFESVAKIQNYLTKITDDNDYQNITENLPQAAGGGTSICSGLREGFKVIMTHSQSTSGSEIILLTDGEDDYITSCFEEVKQSGAIIHTIALGPSAAKELETLSTMTGGHRFFANKDINGLIDAFSRISSRSGNITQQAVQLESKALNITTGKWINGTVLVDSTIGNDTFFVVTWTTQKPEILLQDPKGTKYGTSDFKEDKLNIRSARLRIPGVAETGTWTYSLLNKHPNSQLLSVTVTTRARSPATLPVIATAHMSQNTAQYPSPMIVYARVSQGFLPVLGINVTAIIENEDGHQVTLELWDNGAGADTVKNDGIYSRYFTDYHGNGRYSLKVYAQARKNIARLSLRQRQNQALYVPGYVENGKIILNAPRPEVKDDLTEVEVEDFNRLTSGGSFTVSGAPPAGENTIVFLPGKITDLKASYKEDHIHLSWTAPGNVLDKGKVNRYIIRISKCFLDLEKDFDNASLVNTSSLMPKEAGSNENYEFKPEPFTTENGTKFYIAIQSISQANLTSEVSNIAPATKFIPSQESSSPTLGSNISAINLVIFGLLMIFLIF